MKAMKTDGSGPASMDISDQLVTLMCMVQSLNSNWKWKGKHPSRAIIIAPTDAVLVLLIGAQVVFMAPISPESTKDTIGTDGSDCQ